MRWTCRAQSYSGCSCRRRFRSLLVDIDIGSVDDGADVKIAVTLHRFTRRHAAEIRLDPIYQSGAIGVNELVVAFRFRFRRTKVRLYVTQLN